MTGQADENGRNSQTTMTTRLVEQWIAALNAHDVDACATLLADDYLEVGPTATIRGVAAARADLLDTFTSQPDVHIAVTALVATGETAAVEYVMTGTLVAPIHRTDGTQLPATGRSYAMSGCSFVWTGDGRITTLHHYWDRALMREQLGLPG